MTLTTPYSATFIVGDGETKTFSYLFEEVSPNFISVMVYNSLTGLISTPTYIIDTDQKQVIFGEDTPAPTADETVCIYRNTPNVQDVAFRTLHGYDAQTLENILSKIVAMIQEIKSNYFSTQVLQGDPWQLDLLSSADDGATVNIDYTAKKLVKGLYFRITSGNLQVSADGTNYITMPKSADVVEFRQHETVKEDLTVEYRLQYRVGNTWYNAESNAESTANEALQVAEEARDVANDAKDIAQDASDKVDGFDDRLTQAEQNASDAKDIAQDASDAVSAHITDTNNPHNVTAAQIGALPDTTKYGATLSLTIDSTSYVVTAQLKDQDGNNLGTAQTIDLPLESVVVSGAYDSVTKEVVLTLQGGSTIRFSVADLVSGLQTEITALNMLSADLVDDTNTTHKFVTTTEKSTWNGKQDAISDLATIRSGATAGATAVQPGSLATVATTGNYNDLSNRPTIPTVGDGTITIKQGGVFKGSFTTNQSGDTEIDIDAGGGSGGVQSIDAEIVGTLTVADNGDVSGFGNSNYLRFPGDVDMTGANSFEIVASFTTTVSGLTVYLLAENPVSILSDKHLTFMASTHIRFDVNDGSNYQTLEGITSLSAKTKYYAKLTYDGTNYTLSLSTDGINYTTEATAAAQYIPGKITYEYLIGRVSAGTQVHLSNYYIKKDGILVWQGLGDPGLHQRVSKAEADYVVESQFPTAENNFTWYRKYKSGWVEQGGQTESSAGNVAKNITFPIEMADTNYTVQVTIRGGLPYGAPGNNPGVKDTNTTTGMAIYSGNTGALYWEVKGMAAQ